MVKTHSYLNFAGNAEEAFNFYKSVFGGELSSVVRFKDFPMEGVEIPQADEDKMMHIALPIGDNILMASDVLESQGQQLVQGNNNYVMVSPDTKEEANKIFNGLSQGADVEMPIADQPWGDYFGSLKDKFGVMWMVDVASSQES
ncbi:MAG: VOC family protein [Actinomycetota bacterium]|nr:VOC family protein [Actinomycetota bacterium]